MSATKKKPATAQSYEKLGRLLESWRSEVYRSAAEMFRECKFSFAYSTYAEFERGISLPSIEHLMEVAAALKKEPDEAVWLWAEVQMPTPRLKALFQRGPTAAPAAAPTQDVFGFESQWVFGKAEHDFLAREPWFFDLCLMLVLAHPGEVSYEALGLRTSEEVTAFKEKYLKAWILLGRIRETTTGLQSADSHLLIPNTPDWATVRARNYDRAYANLSAGMTAEAMRDQAAYREIATRCLTAEQMQEWIARLRDLDRNFRSYPGVDLPADEGNKPHTLLMALGPRQLRLPEDVLAKCRD